MDGTLSGWSRAADRRQLLAFGDSCLRGVGQIIFMNNPITGALIIAGLCVTGPWLATLSVVGMTVATATAHLMGLDRSAIRAGLFGFNGTLIGGALAVFLVPEWDGEVVAFTVIGAALTVPVTAAISAALVPTVGVPGLTLPFNVVAMTILAMTTQVTRGHAGPALSPTAESSVSPDLRADPLSDRVGWLEGIANGTLRGIGQLFFADSVWAGLLILAGLVVCSRIAAAVALGGSALGVATGLAVGADGVAIYHGLYGYTGFVTAVAVAGVFFVPTARAILYGAVAAVWSTVTLVAVGHVLAPIGIPAMTVPFCLVAIGMLLLRDVPGLHRVPLARITTPEAHRRLPRATGE